MVRKREDGRWEGRIVVGHKENGDSIFRYIYADTQKELTAKLRQNIDMCWPKPRKNCWPSFTVTWISIRTHSSLRTAV